MITDQRIFSVIRQHLPEIEPVGPLLPIAGGNLNHVWRLEGNTQNVIIKWAPPHIAASPEVPLSPRRIDFEARALNLFSEGELLHSLTSDEIRPPKLLHYEQDDHLLVMEDLGSLPAIAEWVTSTENASLGNHLGDFIGGLHHMTFSNSTLRRHFNNRDIQQTRQKVQYNPAAEYLSKTGLSDMDSNHVSQKTKALGQKLLEPGQCLVMGDLWPPSVLADNGNIRLIDWEFAHFGRPLQDVGHFAAHCWMQAHSASSKKQGALFQSLWNNFWEAYQKTMGDTHKQLFSDAEMNDMTTHVGAEILVRVSGPFKEGYVYEALPHEHPTIKEAARKAQAMILGNHLAVLWA